MAEALTPRDPRKLGRWRITSRLGFGGMGVVYLGTDGHQEAAVKVIRPGLLDDQKMVERFVREVAVLQAVRDVHISQFLDANLTSEPAWLAIEYIGGPTVKQQVDADGPLRAEKWWSLAAGIAQALAVLEVHRVTHRDIKPSNVILSGPGGSRAVLIDFGIAHPEDATSLTATGLVTGSPSWLSPEQANTAETGAPSDVFSLGSLLAYAGTGRPPFGEGVAVAVLMRITSSEPDLQGLDPDQRELVSAMLAKDPALRPSARDVLARARAGARRASGIGSDHTMPGFVPTTVLPLDAPDEPAAPLASSVDTTSPDLPALAPVADPGPPPTPAPMNPGAAAAAAWAVTPPTAGSPAAPVPPVTPMPAPAQPPSAGYPPPVAAPAPRTRRSPLPWIVAVLAVLVAGLAIWKMAGSPSSGGGSPSGSPTSTSSSTASPSQSPSSNGSAPAAPSGDSLRAGDWSLDSYRLGNDAASMWLDGKVTNRGKAAASARLVAWLYVNGTSIGSVATTVTDIPAGGSAEVHMTGDARWKPGTKVVLLQAEPS